MKKFRFKFVICLVLVLALSMTAATTVSATEGDQIATDTVEAWKYAGGWGIDSSYTANGVCASVPGADTVGSDNAWSYRVFIPNDASISPAFSIADGNKVVIELSVNFFDEQGIPSPILRMVMHWIFTLRTLPIRISSWVCSAFGRTPAPQPWATIPARFTAPIGTIRAQVIGSSVTQPSLPNS